MSIYITIKRLLKQPRKIIRLMGSKNLLNFIPDKQYLKLIFRAETGRKLNLNNPKSFNEKLQWLKLYDRKKGYNSFVDKYLVREHITKTIGSEYLVPLIGVYEKVDDIPWEELPNQFVIKCTHGSGCNIICKNKDDLNIKKAKIKLKKWMKRNWYWFGRAWVYKDLVPKIIIEEFISDNGNTPDDYKVLCFHGKAKLIEVHIDRFGNHTSDKYDIDFNKTNITQSRPSNIIYKKPKCFDEMIRLSEKLSKDFIHIRIDWYIVRNRLYFGEMTFYDGSGFANFDHYEHDLLLGSWIELPI